MKKYIYSLIIILFFTTTCKKSELLNTHGIAYLEKREKLIVVNKSNKNDTINVLGQPSTKGMTDDNLWIYIERSTTRGSLLKLGKSYLKKNNILVLEFDKYGILSKKKFYNKTNMKKLSFAKDVTENEIRKANFIESFLSSIKQKMKQRRQ